MSEDRSELRSLEPVTSPEIVDRRPFPGLIFFSAPGRRGVVAVAGVVVNLPFKDQKIDYQLVNKAFENRDAVEASLPEQKSFFITDGNSWQKSGGFEAEELEKSLDNGLSLVLVLTGNPNSPVEVFHYGRNRSGGFINTAKGSPDLPKLIATAALTKIVMTNDRLSEVRWIKNIQSPILVGTVAETPMAIVGNIANDLRADPILKRPHVFAEYLKSIYRGLRYDISPVGVGKMMR